MINNTWTLKIKIVSKSAKKLAIFCSTFIKIFANCGNALKHMLLTVCHNSIKVKCCYDLKIASSMQPRPTFLTEVRLARGALIFLND